MILKINNVVMPSPIEDGFTYTEEKIWSENAGRNNKGDAIGTILAIKKTIDIQFPLLDHKTVDKINNEVSNISKPFVSVLYDSELNDGLKFEGKCYFASVAVPIKGFRNGKSIVKGYKIQGVQK